MRAYMTPDQKKIFEESRLNLIRIARREKERVGRDASALQKAIPEPLKSVSEDETKPRD